MNTRALYYSPIESGHVYHIYNRAIGNEKLFFREDNYSYFLKKYNEYLSPYLETYCYCLLPNHFHLLVHVKDNLPESDKKISEQFRGFFIGYAQAINKQQSRKGGLFMRPFKRKPVLEEKYLRELVIYIHNNPVYHQYVTDINKYKWSSYQDIVNAHSGMTSLEGMSSLVNETVTWFHNWDNFVFCHKQKQELFNIKEFMIEE